MRKSVYILHYPKGKLSVSYGLINELNELISEKKHISNSEESSSGFPILSLEIFKIIGIHLGRFQNTNIKINDVIFIKKVIEAFNNEHNNKKENKGHKNEINILYESNNESEEAIFGEKFVKNNINNIELEINGIKINLIKEYKLNKGKNIIKLK